LIKSKKSLGQNFLVDSRVARRIVDAVSPIPGDLIIEIGPGTGALTRILLERTGHIAAIEIDARMIEELRRSGIAANLTIVEADVLDVDWPSLVETLVARSGADDEVRRVRVVANLPYYISTPIIERLIRSRQLFDMTVMLQSEVVDRIAAAPGGKEYGYLSVLVQYYCIVTRLFEAPPSAFKPPPKVWSAVVRLVVREHPAVDVDDAESFFALVRAAFAQRRKTIANNLKAVVAIAMHPGLVELALERAHIDSRRRAETLSIEEFGALYRALKGKR
jgi:16S rRNA (adenine1518-N6/adenine1519-N6)-dimethyltransferase